MQEVINLEIGKSTMQHIFNFTQPGIIIVICVMLFGCSNDVSTSAEYYAARHGEPLKTVEQRNQAMEDGLPINQQYKCIDKAALLARQEQDKLDAMQAAETLVKQKAEDKARDAQIAQRREERRAAEEAKRALRYALRLIEINSASETELARVCSIHADTASDIVQERTERGAFKDWVDVVHRVIALSSAQNVVFASTCGLTVNGESFNGAPADEDAAQAIFQRYLR